MDTYTTKNGEKIRLINNSILVKPDPTPDRKGLIHFPDGSMEHVLNTGEVVAVGYEETKKGRRYPIPDLEPGEKVVFVRFLAEQDSNKQVRRMMDGTVRIRPSDVLLVYTPDEQDRVR